MNKKNLTTSTRLKSYIICSLVLSTSICGAIPRTQNVSSNVTQQTNSDKQLITQLHTIIDFEKMKPLQIGDFIKTQLLIFYSSKSEKIVATYLDGAYAIKYTQKW